MSPSILTCKLGNNADLFPDILSLYVPEGSKVLDMTFGKGVFWKKVDTSKYDLVTNDINPELGDYHDDATKRTRWNNDTFDAVVLDFPYLYVGGFKTLKGTLDANYNNKSRALDQGIYGVKAVDKMYRDGMVEAFRILKPKGILVSKCMDQVQSGIQVWQHVTYLNYGTDIGFRNEDLFVLMKRGQPMMRHKHQLHARRNHSYALVFRKPKPSNKRSIDKVVEVV